MVRIKICGIKGLGDAMVAAAAGADMLGFNFYEPSPRYIEPGLARNIVFELAGRVKSVGLFVNPDFEHAKKVMAESGMDMIQLHGDEPPEFCEKFEWPVIKALRVGSADDLVGIGDYKVHAMLIDSRSEKYGGSGKTVDWELAAGARDKCDKLMLAGGLTPENVAEAIDIVRPWAVDVASGVESEPGVKDLDKMEAFIDAVRKTD